MSAISETLLQTEVPFCSLDCEQRWWREELWRKGLAGLDAERVMLADLLDGRYPDILPKREADDLFIAAMQVRIDDLMAPRRVT